MTKRPSWTLVLCFIVISFGVRLVAVGCQSNTAGVRGIGTLDGDGVRHIRVFAGGSLQPGSADALRAAAEQWNGFSNTTLLHFDVVTSGDSDVTVVRDSYGFVANSGGLCAGTADNSILVEPWMDDLGASPSTLIMGPNISHATALRTTFAHELGHILNLAQAPGENSIMAGSSGTSCADAWYNHPPSQFDVQ